MKKNKMQQLVKACIVPLLFLVFTACGGDDSHSVDPTPNSPNGQASVNQEGNSYNLKITASYSQVQVTANVPGLYSFYYSKTENGPYTRYSYLDDNKVVQTSCNNQFTIKGLTPGTSYYCYIVYGKDKSKVLSFKTKDLDLSSVESSAVKSSIINSYTDRYGQKQDLSWLGNKYTVSITSNLSNSYRYGVLAIQGVNEETLTSYINSSFEENNIHYSTSTSSPYTISINNYPSVINGFWISEAYDSIMFLVKLANSKNATSDDYDELDALLDEVKTNTNGLNGLFIRAFVEINGERIYFGKYWK